MPYLPYYDNIDPGQGGSAMVIPEYPPFDLSRYQRFPCQKCESEFTSYEAWFQHRFEFHPLLRPTLFLGTREITSPRLIVTAPLNADQMRIVNTMECWLDERKVGIASLAQTLAKTRAGFFKVKLLGEQPGLQSDYEISIEIPADADVLRVESEFQRVTRAGVLSVVSVNQFIQNTLEARTARRYVDGLAAYLYGVLAKDQKGDTHLTQQQGRARLNEALQNLSEIGRPLATTITAIINFQCNAFASNDSLAAAPRLRLAMDWFEAARRGQDLSTLYRDETRPAPTSHVLLDAATDELLSWVALRLTKLREQAKFIERRARQDDWLPEDRTKAKVVATVLAEFEGDVMRAAQIARGFRHDPVFGNLAERLIAKSKDMGA